MMRKEYQKECHPDFVFGKLHYKCEVLREMMTCKSHSKFHNFFLLLFFMEQRLERRDTQLLWQFHYVLYIEDILNPNDKSHLRNIFIQKRSKKKIFSWTYYGFGADFLCLLERDKTEWNRTFSIFLFADCLNVLYLLCACVCLYIIFLKK